MDFRTIPMNPNIRPVQNTQFFYLNVPFEEKDEAKALGARWDPQKKKWYFQRPQDFEKFVRWMPDFYHINLSEEQNRVIETAKEGKNILVDACIGSGKTTTIQEMCNVLDNKKILYLTYNRLLKEDARKKIVAGNVIVTNYHGFAYGVLTRLGQTVSPNDAIDRFNITKPDIDHFDVLVLDEYQDIDEAIGKMLRHIKEKNPGIQIIAVGDMAQKIYDRTTFEILPFIQEFLGSHENLDFTNCYRLSKAHAERLGRLWGKQINGSNARCLVRELSVAQIVELLAQNDTKDILCLGPRGNSQLTNVLNLLEKRYPDKFNKNTVYASIRDEERSENYKPGSAIFTTYDGSKGMERKICVVFDFSEEYWSTRISQPAAKYEILRNLFLVAASRGKEQIVFAKDQKARRLSDKTITTVVNQKYTHPKPFNASEMYDFNYEEHLKECLGLIKTRRINNKDKEEIAVSSMDGNIDLSPCIGIYTEASFFHNYSIDSAIKTAEIIDGERTLELEADTDLERKILGLVSFETRQKRYMWQVKPPFLTDGQKEKIHNRLSTKFTQDETVQEDCRIVFRDKNDTTYEIRGVCDVVKNDHVYELKFTTALSDQHFLQTAFYVCAMGYKSGYLWNIKTNEMFQIMVPDRKAFLQATVNSITKGNIKKSKSFQRSKRQDEA